MNTLLLVAGVLSIAVGVIHSILGEVLIFKKLRLGSIVPTLAVEPLSERNVRILWATWHIASLFGWALGGLLIQIALTGVVSAGFVIEFIALAMLVSGLLVLFATKGKHPGWIGLCLVALFCWLA